MKKVIIIIFLIATGYFVFQQYNETLSNDDFDEEDEYTYEEALPAIPESCSALAKDYENAYYGARSSDVSHSQKVFAFRKFKACLRKEGFSDDEINATISETEQKAKKKLKQDGYL